MGDHRDRLAEDYVSGPQGTALGTVKLRNGNIARIRSFSVFTTYSFSGLMTGLPTAEINEYCLTEIREWVSQRYKSAMPIHIEKSDFVNIDLGRGEVVPRWPLYFFVAEIESNSFDPDEILASLLLVVFGENSDLGQAAAAINDAAGRLDWEGLAGCWSP